MWCSAGVSGLVLCKSQWLSDALQVIFTTACELVTPKHVVPGTLKILQGQLHFTGELLPEEGLLPQEGPVTKAKVNILRMAYEQASILHVSCDKNSLFVTLVGDVVTLTFTTSQSSLESDDKVS